METSFELPKRKVLVRPIIQKGGNWLPSDHDGAFMYTGTRRGYTVPINRATNQITNPLTEEEAAFFENLFKMNKGDMSVYKRENNYWANRMVFLDKSELTLDLSNPDDYIKWKILLLNTHEILVSSDEADNNGTYKYALIDTSLELKEKANGVIRKTKAYKALAKIDTHKQKMVDAIMIYRITNRNYDMVPEGVSKDTLYTIIEDIIGKDPDGFVSAVEDKDYELKLLVQKLINYKMATTSSHLKNRWQIEGTDLLGYAN